MTVRVFLNIETASQAPPGIRVAQEHSGRWYYDPQAWGRPTGLELEEEALPPAIAPLVQEISVWAIVPQSPSRDRGRYKLRAATAIVDQTNPTAVYSLNIRGENWADTQALFYAIRAGTVSPFESWEKPLIRQGLSSLIRRLLRIA